MTTSEITALIAVGLTLVTLLGSLTVAVWRASSILTRMEAADKRHDDLISLLKEEISKIQAAITKISKIDLHEQRLSALEVLYREMAGVLVTIRDSLAARSISTASFKAQATTEIRNLKERLPSSPDLGKMK